MARAPTLSPDICRIKWLWHCLQTEGGPTAQGTPLMIRKIITVSNEWIGQSEVLLQTLTSRPRRILLWSRPSHVYVQLPVALCLTLWRLCSPLPNSSSLDSSFSLRHLDRLSLSSLELFWELLRDGVGDKIKGKVSAEQGLEQNNILPSSRADKSIFMDASLCEHRAMQISPHQRNC